MRKPSPPSPEATLVPPLDGFAQDYELGPIVASTSSTRSPEHPTLARTFTRSSSSTTSHRPLHDERPPPALTSSTSAPSSNALTSAPVAVLTAAAPTNTVRHNDGLLNEKTAGLGDVVVDHRENLLLAVAPPAPFDVQIENLTIGLPSSRPSRIPAFLRCGGAGSKKKDKAPSGEGEGNQSASSVLDERLTANSAHRKRTIVRNVVGRCNSGEVLGLLGGSGSGKTTLLNALANRLGKLPILEGDVQFRPSPGEDGGMAGAVIEGKKKGRIIGFVRQQDYLLPHLTVRETLNFAAALRLPRSVSENERRAIVDQTIEELGLRDAADTIVGGALRKGISGGERRRLSIGCVLVTLPSVLLLDEPTSGLDAFTAHLLLETLSRLAKRNRTIIISLHAPRSDAFSLLDRLILLSKGDVVYSGKTADSLEWFHERGWDVEKGTNPLDFLIDVSSVDNRDPDKEAESRERVNSLIMAWRASPRSQSQLIEKHSYSANKAAISGINPDNGGGGLSVSHSRSATSEVKERNEADQRRPGFAAQTIVLLRRGHLNVYRNFTQLIGFAAQAIIIGTLVGFTFFQLGETLADIQSIKNISFQFIPAYFYLTQVYWIYTYCNSLTIFDREREDNLYSVVPYVLSEFLSMLIPSIVTPATYTIILYTMAGLREDPYASSLFTCVAVSVATQWATQGLALMSASIIRNFAQASIICNALSLFQTLSAGFVLVSVPPWVAWFRWISPQFYGYRIIAPTLLANRQFACQGVTGDLINQCDGNKVLNGLKISANQNIGIWFAGLLSLFLVEHVIAALLLQFHHPGGVRVAGKGGAERGGKESTATGELDFPRARIDVEINHLSFTWSRRSFWPFFGAAKKRILNDVSAYFPAGEVSAIIGPSGAGKSTILQLLAHREMKAGAFGSFSIEGSMTFNGEAASKDLKSSIAFVEQEDDYHLSGLTVRETLRYAAILRLPESMSRKKKEARAEEVLLMLGLKDCANVLVGGPLIKGISGGEKRRLSLAVQMINDPSVLVIDEPTSGLDAFIAQNVMQCLTEIARTGRTVIATIHQPRSDIVTAFDNLCVLAKGGDVVYSGKNDLSIPWFEAQGHPLPTEAFNPADHILDIVSIDTRPGREAASQQRVNDLKLRWAENVTKMELEEDVEASPAERNTEELPASKYTSIHISMPVVLSRMILNLWRQREAFWNRLVQAPFLAALFILFYTRLTKGPAGAQDRIGVTMENVNAIPFVGLLNGIAIFPQDRDIFFHEHHSAAAYSAATFITAYTIFEVSMTLVASFLYALIMHVAVGMQTSVRIYFEFSISIFCLQSLGESVAICFASIATQVGFAVSLVSTALAVVCQISGIISLSMPNWLAAIAWVTPLKPAVKIQFINECRGLMFNCDAASITSGACVATSGDSLLAALGFNDMDTSKFMGIMIASTVGWRVLSWATLQFKVSRG